MKSTFIKRLFVLGTAGLATLTSTVPFSLQAQAQPSKGQRDIARENFLDNLLATDRFVNFPRPSIFYRKEEQGEYNATFAGEAYDHPQGVFGSRRVEFLDYPANPSFKGFSLLSSDNYRVWPDGTTFLSREACLEKARELKALTWPDANFKSGQATERVVKEDQYSVVIRWDYYEATQMLRRFITIRIRKIDGKCSYIHGAEFKWTNNEDADKPAVSYKLANAAASKLLNTRPAYKPAKLSSWKIERPNGEYYVFQYELPVKEGGKRPAESFKVFVNTDSGEAFFGLPKEPEFRQNSDYQDQNMRENSYSGESGISYDKPFWTRQGLVFGSGNFRQSFDAENIGSKLILRDRLGKFSVLYKPVDWRYNVLFAAPWSDWIIIDDGNGSYAINVANGRTTKLASNGQSIGVLNRSQLGQNIMAGESNEVVIGSKNNTRTIETLPPSTSNSEYKAKPPVTMKFHDDLNVCFSPDGRSVFLYRSTDRAGETRKGVSIRKMDTRKYLDATSKVKRDLIKESVPFFYMPYRIKKMAFYPEGQQIFVDTGDYEVPAVVFDLKTRKLTPISTDDLYQKNAGVLSGVDEIYQGEKSGELVIKASKNEDEAEIDEKNDNEPESAPNYFFTCRLNGSNLKQLVPKGEPKVLYHQFSSGKSGYDVTKEIGLQQVVW